jgi:hypothetical protein
MILESPPGFIVRTEAQHAAWITAIGWNEALPMYGCITPRPQPRLDLDRGLLRLWPLAAVHRSFRRCGRDRLSERFAVRGSRRSDLRLSTIKELHVALDHVYKLAMNLPETPLDRFKAKTTNLPRTTEAERWVIQRIGQDAFRSALMDYWNGRCSLTGITDPAVLRASHICPLVGLR